MSVVARSEIGKGIPFELFFICQWFERMYLCDFVALSVRMCVAGKSSGNCAWNLAFPVFISPIVWNMCENLHYEWVYFKELHNQQEYY